MAEISVFAENMAMKTVARQRGMAERMLTHGSMERLKASVSRRSMDLDEHLERVLEGALTIWDLEQMMRHDLMTLAQDEGGLEDQKALCAVLEKYPGYARRTGAGTVKRIDPWDDLWPAWERALAWVRERTAPNTGLSKFRIAKCSAGRRRWFIDDGAMGLESALAQLGLVLRWEMRSHVPEIQMADGTWEEVDDRKEATLRETIAGIFSFARSDGDSGDRPKAKPARWTDTQWRQLLNVVMGEREVDAFRHWLDTLERWDGTPRLDRWMLECGFRPATDTDPGLLAWASRSVPMLAIARTLKPGIKHDIVPVITGPQGIGKSTAFAWLLPPETRSKWFCDALKLSGSDKERVEALQGAVIVEVSEMTGSTTADIESMKAFLSRTDDRVRLSYRKNPETFPRMISLVGTANGTAILPNDPTGNRRFLAIAMKDGSAATTRTWLDENRHHLWAEALMRVTLGEPVHLPSELELEQRRANEAFRSADSMLEDAITAFLVTRFEQKSMRFHIAEIVEELKLVHPEHGTASLPLPQHRRIMRILERLGLKQVRARHEGALRRMWSIPENFDLVVELFSSPKHDGDGDDT